MTPADHQLVASARDAALTEMDLHMSRASGAEKVIKGMGEIDWLDQCAVCDWTGKALGQHARYCKVEVCPHRKGDPEPDIQERMETVRSSKGKK